MLFEDKRLQKLAGILSEGTEGDSCGCDCEEGSCMHREDGYMNRNVPNADNDVTEKDLREFVKNILNSGVK